MTERIHWSALGWRVAWIQHCRQVPVIVPSAVIDGCGHRYPTDPEASNLLGGATPHLLLGASTVAATVAEKARLYSETGAAAIDLESAAVARVARMHRATFAVLRAICDTSARALPPAALAALDTRGAIAIGRVLASIVARPAQIPALLALASDAMTALCALCRRVKVVKEGSTRRTRRIHGDPLIPLLADPGD